jgi:uncharacterized membrane protein YozB (DUF420 family)
MYSFADIFFLAALSWGLLACALIIIAWLFARIGNFTRHKHTMLIMLGGGWSFVLLYLFGYIFDHSYSEAVSPHIVYWLSVHGIVALITLCAVTILIWARLSGPEPGGDQRATPDDTNALRSYINSHHRLFGTLTVLFWLFTQAGGFINLYLLR